MSMNDLQEAFQIIKSNIEESDFEKEPKGEELIKKAEEKLGIIFPPTYRLFLKTFGCGSFKDTEFYGIIDDEFSFLNAPDSIGLTLEDRKKGYIPRHFILISDVGDGFYYYLDSSEVNDQGEYPVVVWGYGVPESKKEKVNNDFGEFLLEQVRSSLSLSEEA